MTDVRWHAVYANIRCEGRAETGLIEHGYHTFYPIIERVVKHARREMVAIRPLFPRYLFIGLLPGQSLYHARKTDGVVDVLRSTNGEPVTVAARVVQALAADQLNGRFKLKDDHSPAWISSGASVLFVSGPFSDMPATIVSMRGKDRVEIMFSMFGKHDHTDIVTLDQIRQPQYVAA